MPPNHSSTTPCRPNSRVQSFMIRFFNIETGLSSGPGGSDRWTPSQRSVRMVVRQAERAAIVATGQPFLDAAKGTLIPVG